jgi:DNA polymerase III epsilon subunit-like protein
MTPIEKANYWLTLNPLFLDTETTGIASAEIVDIAIIDALGEVCLNSLVCPTRPIPLAVTDVHGITNQMVSLNHAPSFPDIWPHIKHFLRGRHVVVYNAAYDQARLFDSALYTNLKDDAEKFFNRLQIQRDRDLPAPVFHCAMELYAEFFGEWNNHRQSFRWQKLGAALDQQHIDISHLALHRALADAEACRLLVRHMARGAQ